MRLSDEKRLFLDCQDSLGTKHEGRTKNEIVTKGAFLVSASIRALRGRCGARPKQNIHRFMSAPLSRFSPFSLHDEKACSFSKTGSGPTQGDSTYNTVFCRRHRRGGLRASCTRHCGTRHCRPAAVSLSRCLLAVRTHHTNEDDACRCCWNYAAAIYM